MIGATKLSPAEQKAFYDEQGYVVHPDLLSQDEAAECPAGGVEIHHCNMVHSSTANRGTNPRSVLIFQYRAADNVLLGGSGGAYGVGTVVRGVDPYQARLLDGTIVKLPGEIKDPLQRDG